MAHREACCILARTAAQFDTLKHTRSTSAGIWAPKLMAVRCADSHPEMQEGLQEEQVRHIPQEGVSEFTTCTCSSCEIPASAYCVS